MRTKGLTKKMDRKAISEVRKLEGARTVLGGTVPGYVLRFLNTHADRLMKEVVSAVFGRVEITPAVSVAILTKKRLGQYLIDRDGMGLRWRIEINAKHLGRSEADSVCTVLHELLHALQEDYGAPGKKNYHNEEYQAWSWWLGIPSDSGGCTSEVYSHSVFTEYCRRGGIDSSKLVDQKEQKLLPKPKGSPLKKWTCSCGTNARVATMFDATCNLCETKFELQEAA